MGQITNVAKNMGNGVTSQVAKGFGVGSGTVGKAGSINRLMT